MADLTCTAGKITPTEIVNAINARVEENAPITGATKTKITYDAKGLVTAGADATTADIPASTNKNYVTDADAVVIGNTSNTNSGDNATNTLYSSLVSNVPTVLSNGTASTTVVNITSDGSTDDLVLTAATTTKAGIMDKAIFDEHVANNAKATNVSSNLALGTPTAVAYPITNSDGTGFSIPEADTNNAGLLGSNKWDEIVANSLKTSNIPTVLSNGTASTTVVNITSDGSTDDVVITAATTTKSGIMTKVIFDEHVVNNGKTSNIQSNLSLGTSTATTYPVLNSDGTGFSIPEATTLKAGLLGAAKWDEIVANSLKATNVPTVLSNGTASTTVVNITSDGSTDDVALATASTTAAGIMTKTIFDEHVVNNGKATNVPTVLSNGTASTTVVNITSDGSTDDVVITAASASKSGIMTSTMFNTLAAAAPLASPTFTGTVVLPATTVVNLVTDTTPQLGGDLDFNGKTANESAVRQIADATPATTTTHTFAYANGDMQQITCPAAGTLTLAFSGFPTGDVSGFICDIINGGNCTITHPTGMLFGGGTAPTFTTAGTDRILVTSDKDAVLTLTVIAIDIGVE